MTHKQTSRYEIVVRMADGRHEEFGRFGWYTLADARRRAREEITAGATLADIYRITYPPFGPSIETHVQVIEA